MYDVVALGELLVHRCINFEDNVAISRAVVQACHPSGVPVEVELGKVGGERNFFHFFYLCLLIISQILDHEQGFYTIVYLKSLGVKIDKKKNTNKYGSK